MAVPLAALWIAFALDLAFGEPAARWHPVVWMGRYLQAAGARIAPVVGAAEPAPARVFARGAAAWLLGASVVAVIAFLVHAMLQRLPAWAASPVLGVALKPLLAWRMLRDETAGVEQALADSLGAGRGRLARLVSRDVAQLDAQGVRESAIESLAENLNDSVVAPVFWFVLFGLPGAAVYRFANTADAMWGYRGVRGGRTWEWAGKFAARADDALSWLPARLTALLIAAAHRGLAWRALRLEASRTASPNSGWPMAAMALALDVRLGKPGAYVLHAAGRPPAAEDGRRAQAIASRAVMLLVALASGTILLGGLR
jgi:adenosylcobinamide-phosphate synthase